MWSPFLSGIFYFPDKVPVPIVFPFSMDVLMSLAALSIMFYEQLHGAISDSSSHRVFFPAKNMASVANRFTYVMLEL